MPDDPATYSGPEPFELHLTAVNGVPVRDRSDCACASPDFELGFQPETGYPPTVYTVHRIDPEPRCQCGHGWKWHPGGGNCFGSAINHSPAAELACPCSTFQEAT